VTQMFENCQHPDYNQIDFVDNNLSLIEAIDRVKYSISKFKKFFKRGNRNNRLNNL